MYSQERRSALQSGTPAPDFNLRSTPDQWLTLNEFPGQPVVLAFYPANWSPVCGDQMALYNEMLPDFLFLPISSRKATSHDATASIATKTA
jgi:peroxiredoxin